MPGFQVTILAAISSARETAPGERPLAVVVVTYNSADTLGGLLDTMADGLAGVSRSEVIIADNGSTDDSADIAEGHPIGARVVRTGRNGGYAAGINAALATVGREADALILNPDIRLSPGAAARLVARLRQPGTGVAVPRILHDAGVLFHSLRREPSLRTAWADALLGARLGSGIDVGESICRDTFYDLPGTVDWASGAALAISAEARGQVGDWDESFFLYSEEVDYQRRVRLAGFQIAYVPQAEVIHIGGDYSGNPQLYSILTANRLRDYGRHHGTVSTALFRLAVLTGEALRSLGGSAVHRAGVVAALGREVRPAHVAVAAPDAGDA
jgi:GT2 family glycosyltransferase